MFIYILIMDIPREMDMFHPHPMWSPYGTHMESMWNEDPKIGGISAKMYSIWNGGIHVKSMWNEVHSMWSPCGVYVEYKGRVKTLTLDSHPFWVWAQWNIFQLNLDQSPKFFKAILTALTNPHDISDSITVTPLLEPCITKDHCLYIVKWELEFWKGD